MPRRLNAIAMPQGAEAGVPLRWPRSNPPRRCGLTKSAAVLMPHRAVAGAGRFVVISAKVCKNCHTRPDRQASRRSRGGAGLSPRCTMPHDQLTQDLYQAICRIPLIDPHSHINPHRAAARGLDDLLGYHYYTELAHSAGMDKKPLAPEVEPRQR